MKKIINPWIGLEKEGYNCIGCAPNNPYGLKMEFYEDGDDIVSFWTPSDNYQGWLHTLHGGIQSLLIDEIAGWLVARKLQTSGMTTNLKVQFKRPIATGSDITLEIRARLTGVRHNIASISAQILCRGQLCTSGELTYFCFSKEKAASDFYFTACHTVDEEM